jgi:hypothetical protein
LNTTCPHTDIHELFAHARSAALPASLSPTRRTGDWNSASSPHIAVAIDAYLKELGKDCAQHARTSFDVKVFTDPVSDALDDCLGQMERAAEAARVHHSLPAE